MPALGSLRQVSVYEFEASLAYTISLGQSGYIGRLKNAAFNFFGVLCSDIKLAIILDVIFYQSMK